MPHRSVQDAHKVGRECTTTQRIASPTSMSGGTSVARRVRASGVTVRGRHVLERCVVNEVPSVTPSAGEVVQCVRCSKKKCPPPSSSA